MKQLLKNLSAKLTKENLSAIILSSPANIAYVTGFPSPEACLIISQKENIYLADSRYIEAAKNNLKGFRLKQVKGPFAKTIAGVCHNLNLRRIGFEENYISFGNYKKIKETLPRNASLIPTRNFIEAFRQIKTPEELEKIMLAVGITIAAFKFIKGFIKPGIKELEVAAELENFIRYQGASSASFNLIVASGPNSSFPHHLTGQRKIKNNEPVLLDIGVDYQGYKSDLTRVYFLGKIDAKVKRIYDIVRKAKTKAIARIRPAVNINKIDQAARQYINQEGFGGFFGHNTGHGVGLEVHEAPSIGAKEKNKLKAGMVFTVEPGIYLPNEFGIRLEDMVLVTEGGLKVLSGDLDQ